jgi:hypothetical protein
MRSLEYGINETFTSGNDNGAGEGELGKEEEVFLPVALFPTFFNGRKSATFCSNKLHNWEASKSKSKIKKTAFQNIVLSYK